MDRKTVIQRSIDSIGAHTYLEIGVSFGLVFMPIRCRRKIAVDPKFTMPLLKKLYHARNNTGSKYFAETSNTFFEKHGSLFDTDKIGLAFIDGLHSYEQSFRDVEHCLTYLAPRGVIIMHDCNPSSEAVAAPALSGEVWKTIVHLRSARNDLRVAVLDCDCGLGMISRGPAAATLGLDVSKLSGLKYPDLATHREEWLNLHSFEYLGEFLRLTMNSK